ncbi:MAG: 2-C-methyl-D-erythritol 4-phosphate cytidylyltransferase, partial [Chloroflexi bacterium]|nr:2-C-methyl-D-erythritol 4-phosphate cytidylyltransferase [Chloroflexota bacterium]
AAVPVKDTIKVVSENNDVVDTPARDRLWAVQTPQIFRRTLLARAHEEVREDVTDDARMVERIGGTVKVFMGSYENIKVTTPGDLAMVETFLQRGTPSVAEPAR